MTGTAVEVPTNLNTTPYTREVRKWFYDEHKRSVLNAIKEGLKRVRIEYVRDVRCIICR